MRDSQILSEQRRTAAIIDNNTKALAQQFSALIARQSALETVLFGGRFAVLRVLLTWLFRGGEYLLRKVNDEQHQTLTSMKEYANEMTQENKKTIQVINPSAGGILKP